MNLKETLKTSEKNKLYRGYPSKDDARCSDDFILPHFEPKFGINFAKVNSVFTIGSCFARNIEEVLQKIGVDLPTKRFAVSKKEWGGPRPNGLLNEYNPGSIGQKILQTLERKASPLSTIIKDGSAYHDLLLPSSNGVSFERAASRRDEISSVYQSLHSSEVVIITLGYVEAWYDNFAKQWLNRMPPLNKELIESNRFSFRQLDVFDVMPLLSEALGSLDALNKKIILTVSPVPIQTTFTNEDCVIANEFSKSVLRVCAQRLSKHYRNVDYFPSYEVVRTLGLTGYEDDNIHVKNSVVEKITSHMIKQYANV